MKKIRLIFIIVTVFLICNIIYYSTYTINLHYEESELTSNSTNDKIKEEIYEYIKIFDKNIIESLQVCNNEPYKLSEEQIIDISIKYIISNKDSFKDKISYFNEEYKYEKDGTIFYSRGYVDKSFFYDIVAKLFATNNIDIENSRYFDKKRNMIPLILIYGDVSPYIKEEVLDIEEVDYYNYILTKKYYFSESSSFYIKYYIERNDFNEYGKYMLLGMKIN